MPKQLIRYTAVTSVFVMILGSAWIYLSLNESSAAQVNPSQSPVAQEQPFDQNQKLAELAKRIAGQETKPASEVFKNIQLLKAMPAGRLLKVMELGYSKSLGVNCAHCHVVDQWEKDDKPTKQITREMIKMAGTINNDYLKNIKNLKSENPIINCTTCHRGQLKPALNLP
jgi:Photosynthetic reaction centre cytochrome C subunit